MPGGGPPSRSLGAAIFGAILTASLAGTGRSAHDLMHGFRQVFFWTVPFMAVALVLALVMPEKPLSEEMREVAAGQVEVSEYPATPNPGSPGGRPAQPDRLSQSSSPAPTSRATSAGVSGGAKNDPWPSSHSSVTRVASW